MKVKNNGYLSNWQVTEQYLNQNIKPGQVKTEEGLSFQDILEKKQPGEDVKFSKHAMQRLSNRNIELTSGQVERLKEGTAKDRQDAAENVFTNIDGAVII